MNYKYLIVVGGHAGAAPLYPRPCLQLVSFVEVGQEADGNLDTSPRRHGSIPAELRRRF